MLRERSLGSAAWHRGDIGAALLREAAHAGFPPGSVPCSARPGSLRRTTALSNGRRRGRLPRPAASAFVALASLNELPPGAGRCRLFDDDAPWPAASPAGVEPCRGSLTIRSSGQLRGSPRGCRASLTTRKSVGKQFSSTNVDLQTDARAASGVMPWGGASKLATEDAAFASVETLGRKASVGG
jgi:hypothetical protein